MNNQEAKFILGAYRPDGSDAIDPAFREALLQVDRDPELRQWLDRQRAFDSAVAGRLAEIMPPNDLRQAILAGGRASQPPRKRWSSPAWLAAAAGFAVIATVGIIFSSRHQSPLAGFAAAALAELSSAHDDHRGAPPELSAVQARLAAAQLPLLADAGIDLGELSRGHCRTVTIGGREVFEICFQRDGAWFHLYAARRQDAASGTAADAKTVIASAAGSAAAAWADANNVYALVTQASEAALRRLL